MKHKSILQEAEATVHGPRQDTYGHPHPTYKAMKEMLHAIFGDRPVSSLTEIDMLIIMICLKLSRMRNGYHRDSFLDIAGFVACAEMVEEENNRTKK